MTLFIVELANTVIPTYKYFIQISIIQTKFGVFRILTLCDEIL